MWWPRETRGNRIVREIAGRGDSLTRQNKAPFRSSRRDGAIVAR